MCLWTGPCICMQYPGIPEGGVRYRRAGVTCGCKQGGKLVLGAKLHCSAGAEHSSNSWGLSPVFGVIFFQIKTEDNVASGYTHGRKTNPVLYWKVQLVHRSQSPEGRWAGAQSSPGSHFSAKTEASQEKCQHSSNLDSAQNMAEGLQDPQRLL